MKKILYSLLVLSILISNFKYVNASKTTNHVKLEVLTKNSDYILDRKFQNKIDSSAKAFADLMESGAIILDVNGNIIGINIDVLEKLFGVSDDSIRLRRRLNNSKANLLFTNKLTPKYLPSNHITNFSNCFIKLFLEGFGLGEIMGIAYQVGNVLIKNKQYFPFVKKIAELAVKKLGKKAAAKIVAAATPAGWAYTLIEIGTISYRCTVEYDKWA